MASTFRLAAAAVFAGALLLTGCARPTGDFGRAESSPLHDDVMPALGTQRVLAAKEPVSSFNLADQEREMRDRVWRYLVAPHAYDWFGDVAAELQRTRLTPPSRKPLRTDRYYAWLHGERFASSRVRYARLAADVDDDIGTMPGSFRSICAVLEVERQRDVAVDGLGVDAGVEANARARWAENHMVIDWFVRAVINRYESYGYALDHLLVETPHEEAVETNARIGDLAVYAEAAERGDFCDGGPVAGQRAGGVALASRYVISAPSEGDYRK